MEVTAGSLLTVEEARAILRVGRNVMYSIVAKPDFPKIRIGKQIRIPYAAFSTWIEKQIEIV